MFLLKGKVCRTTCI